MSSMATASDENILIAQFTAAALTGLLASENETIGTFPSIEKLVEKAFEIGVKATARHIKGCDIEVIK